VTGAEADRYSDTRNRANHVMAMNQHTVGLTRPWAGGGVTTSAWNAIPSCVVKFPSHDARDGRRRVG